MQSTNYDNSKKRYFKERTSTALATCKRQEKLIDDEISRVNKLVDKDGQLKLI